MRTLISIRYLLALLFCLGAIVDAARAQEKITLKLNLQKGDQRKLAFTMDMDSTVTVNDNSLDMKMQMGMDMAFDIKSVDADGTHKIAITYERIKMKMSGPIEIEFDSDDKDGNGGPLGRVLGALVGQTITMSMTSNGQVKEVLGFEELAKKLGVPKDQLKGQADQMTQMMAALPKKPVAIGESWEGTMKMASNPSMPMTVTAKYTLVDRKNGDAVVKMDGTMKGDQGLDGSMSGTLKIEEATGWTRSGTMTMKMKGKVEGRTAIDMDGKIKFGEAKQP